MPCGQSFSLPRCWPAYAALWAANRRQIRETLEKPRSKAQLFKRFCAKGDACALWLISPFLSVLAGLAALRAANRRLTGKRPKSQGAKLSFSGVSVRGGTFGPTFCVFMEVWRRFSPGGFPPRRREQETGSLLVWENRSRARARTRKQPRACETRGRKRHGARLAHRKCARRRRAGVRDWAKAQTRCATCSAQPRGEGNDRVNRFAGGRRTTGCIAGDEAAGADSPAPGRRVRELPTAGAKKPPRRKPGRLLHVKTEGKLIRRSIS